MKRLAIMVFQRSIIPMLVYIYARYVPDRRLKCKTSKYQLYTFIGTEPRNSRTKLENESRSSFVRELTWILRAEQSNSIKISI